MDDEMILITLTQEDGTELECEQLARLPWQGSDYLVLAPVEDEADEDGVTSVVILRITAENGDVADYATVDEETAQAVLEAYVATLDDEDGQPEA